jgi:hypothetical protein
MRVSISTKIGDVTQSIDIEGDITVDDVAALIGHLALPIPEADQQREEEVLVTLEQLRQAVARNTDAVDAGDKLLSELSAQLRTAIENDDTGASVHTDQCRLPGQAVRWYYIGRLGRQRYFGRDNRCRQGPVLGWRDEWWRGRTSGLILLHRR